MAWWFLSGPSLRSTHSFLQGCWLMMTDLLCRSLVCRTRMKGNKTVVLDLKIKGEEESHHGHDLIMVWWWRDIDLTLLLISNARVATWYTGIVRVSGVSKFARKTAYQIISKGKIINPKNQDLYFSFPPEERIHGSLWIEQSLFLSPLSIYFYLLSLKRSSHLSQVFRYPFLFVV